ncbi:pyridoxal-phosphate dependent enzyme [Streptomyces varsoviensis]|uniref:pyridoxal-phosphate dependent enzyme n=1 Tax=Streptomyces varsoviensis TaxID=67373 RepID=UPI000662B232|nr:pyridoxal-phosphate dependent enzyme [Streptomyces varsoviensis]
MTTVETDDTLLDTLERSAVFQAIGETPLVGSENLAATAGAGSRRLYGKWEGANPGGSIKDRIARRILVDAIASGRVTRNTVIVESSSGNTAIGLAQLCATTGLRMICVIDARTTATHRDLLRAYGVSIEVINAPDPVSGEFLPARLARVRELLAERPNSFWTNQYANQAVISAHVSTTMPEIHQALRRPPDYVYGAVSTCGTLAGCRRYAEQRGWPTRIVAVDILGSGIFGAKARGSRTLPGMGAPYPPAFAAFLDKAHVIHVSEEDCRAGCTRLLTSEGLMAGASSGAVVTAALAHGESTPAGSTHVLLLPDRGERYLDSVFLHDTQAPGAAS